MPALRGGVYVIPVASELDRGWYNSAGEAAPTNTTFGVGGNYTVGMTGAEARNFFIFEIPTLSEPVVRAELVLFVTAPEDGGYVSPDATETLVFYSVDQFSVELLRRRDTNEASVAVFEDLGDGTEYSLPTVLSATNQNSEVTIELNLDFLAALTNHFGEAMALAGRLTSLRLYPEVMEFLFGYSHHVPLERTYLVLYTPAVARLEIDRGLDDTVQLSFPAEYAEYLLESTESLNPPAWTSITLPREEFDGTIYVTLEGLTAGEQYFRLRAPP